MIEPNSCRRTTLRVHIRRAWLATAICLTGAAAFGGTCDTVPTTEPVYPADYRSTFTEVRDCRFSIEHDGVNIRVWANDIAMAGYLAEDNPLPVGSVIIKEEFAGGSCDSDDDLMLISAMRKEEPGFDNEDRDWHFQEVTPTDRRVVTNTKTDCIECHRDCAARDYMCTAE